MGEERSNLCVAKVRGKCWAKYMEGHLHAKGVLYHITLTVIEAYCGDKIHLTDIFRAGACFAYDHDANLNFGGGRRLVGRRVPFTCEKSIS